MNTKPTLRERRLAIQRRMRHEHAQRKERNQQKLLTLRALLDEYERAEQWREVSKMRVRVRNLEQQLRYMRADMP